MYHQPQDNSKQILTQLFYILMSYISIHYHQYLLEERGEEGCQSVAVLNINVRSQLLVKSCLNPMENGTRKREPMTLTLKLDLSLLMV